MEQKYSGRVVLEQNHRLLAGDWAVIAKCVDDVLYVGRCDYGDSDESTSGIDVQPVARLLEWMLRERFGDSGEAVREYALARGVAVSGWVTSEPDGEPALGLCVGEFSLGSGVVVSEVGPRETRSCRIEEACELVLGLLADKCRGSDSWTRVNELIDRSGVSGVPKDRGYV
jgi:hypothetical protein